MVVWWCGGVWCGGRLTLRSRCGCSAPHRTEPHPARSVARHFDYSDFLEAARTGKSNDLKAMLQNALGEAADERSAKGKQSGGKSSRKDRKKPRHGGEGSDSVESSGERSGGLSIDIDHPSKAAGDGEATAVMLAAQNGHTRAVQVLVGYGANVHVTTVRSVRKQHQ